MTWFIIRYHLLDKVHPNFFSFPGREFSWRVTAYLYCCSGHSGWQPWMAFVCRMWLWLNNGINKIWSVIRTSSQAVCHVRNWGRPWEEIFYFKSYFYIHFFGVKELLQITLTWSNLSRSRNFNPGRRVACFQFISLVNFFFLCLTVAIQRKQKCSFLVGTTSEANVKWQHSRKGEGISETLIYILLSCTLPLVKNEGSWQANLFIKVTKV